MYGCTHPIPSLSAVILGYDNGRARGQSDKKAYQQVDDGSGAAANRRQCFFAYETPDNDRIRRIVELLEKGTEQDREEEQQQLFPDHPFCYFVFRRDFGGCRGRLALCFLAHNSSLSK